MSNLIWIVGKIIKIDYILKNNKVTCFINVDCSSKSDISFGRHVNVKIIAFDKLADYCSKNIKLYDTILAECKFVVPRNKPSGYNIIVVDKISKADIYSSSEDIDKLIEDIDV